MTSSVNFKELLAVKFEDIKEPKLLPIGTYHGIISAYECDVTKQKNTPYVRFSYKLQTAGDDIEQGDLVGIDLSARRLSSDFYLTPDAMWRLKSFLASLGFPEGVVLDEMLPDTIGRNVVIYVTHEPDRRDPNAPPRVNVKMVKGEE